MSEQGAFLWILLILVVGFFVVLWVSLDACNEDPSERRDLGFKELVLDPS